jgi:hypothetical protein
MPRKGLVHEGEASHGHERPVVRLFDDREAFVMDGGPEGLVLV